MKIITKFLIQTIIIVLIVSTILSFQLKSNDNKNSQSKSKKIRKQDNAKVISSSTSFEDAGQCCKVEIKSSTTNASSTSIISKNEKCPGQIVDMSVCKEISTKLASDHAKQMSDNNEKMKAHHEQIKNMFSAPLKPDLLGAAKTSETVA